MSDRLARNALYLTVASVGQKILAFVYFLLLARALQPELTGLYSIVLSLVTTFYVVADLGIPSVVIRDVAKNPAGAAALVRRALAFKLPCTVLALILANGAAWALGYEPEARVLVALASGTLFLDSLSLLFYSVLRGLHVLAYEAFGMFVGQLVSLVVGAIVLFTHPSLSVLILVLTCGSLLNVILSAVQVARRLGKEALCPVATRADIRTLGKAALPFFLAAAFVKLFSTLDVQFLKYFWGNADVGVYSVAYKFTYAFQFLPLSFVAALYPAMSDRVGQKDMPGLAALFDKATRYMLLLSVPLALGISFVAGDAVRLVGPGYAAAVPVLLFLPFVLIPSFLDFPIGSLLNAAGRQHIKTALFGATLVVNVVCDALLVPTYGMWGAGIGSLISLVFLVTGGFLCVPRVIQGYRLTRVWKLALPILLAGAAMRVAIHFTREAAIWLKLGLKMELLAVVLVACLVYVAGLYATRAIGPEDLRMFTRVFRRSSVEEKNEAYV